MSSRSLEASVANKPKSPRCAIFFIMAIEFTIEGWIRKRRIVFSPLRGDLRSSKSLLAICRT
jgi:hypothetical protein